MDSASHRACAYCRSQKVRCIPDDANPDICQRCQRMGRSCVFTPLQKRKQRKRTDTRVAELEREMRTMRAMFKAKGDTAQRGSGKSTTEPSEERAGRGRPPNCWVDEINSAGSTLHPQDSAAATSTGMHGQAITSNQSTNAFTAPFSALPDGDVVQRGLLSMATARQLVESYKDELHPHCPIVHIPQSYTADQMRAEKPTLFLAVLAAAAIMDQPDLSEVLDAEILRTYASRSLVNSEKSPEIIQALVISAAWYAPPKKFGQLKYYEYIHMAVIMSMEIGIGTRSVNDQRHNFGPRSSGSNLHPAEDVKNPDMSMALRHQPQSDGTTSTEARRTFLAVFCMATGCSVSLRRPNMFRPTAYLRECLDYMEEAPDTVPSDAALVAWARLMLIASEITEAFSFDDPATIASISDVKTQLMMRDFERRLTEWDSNVPASAYVPGLKLNYYYTRMCLHELVLHVDHSPEDFKAPYQMGRLRPYEGPDELPTRPLIECIAECIKSAHAAMDVFLALDVKNARALPVLAAVRISFAAFVIAKLSLSLASKHSRIASLMEKRSLKAESYMDRLILHVRNIIGPQGCRVPAIFLALLFKVRQWCANPDLIEKRSEIPKIVGQTNDSTAFNFQQPETQVTRAIDGPRITEHFSSSENSPEFASNASASSMQQYANVNNASFQPFAGDVSAHTSRVNSLSTDTSPTGIDMSASLDTLPEQMELDSDFFSFLEDVNAYQGGGLTGLDDWGALPSEMMSMSGMVNGSTWPNTSINTTI